MKTLMLEEVRKKLYGRLRETASGIVKEVVRREIAERVRKQVRLLDSMSNCTHNNSMLRLAVARANSAEASGRCGDL